MQAHTVRMAELQKELYALRCYHMTLHAEYARYKTMYQETMAMNQEEWKIFDSLHLTEEVSKAISKFWSDVEYLATSYFEVQKLLDRKKELEKDITAIWKTQLASSPVEEKNEEKLTIDRSDLVPANYLDYLKAQIVEMNNRIKWVEFHLMKYKFASKHAEELKSIVDGILKEAKKQTKWQMLKGAVGRHKDLLRTEVHWYKRRLRFFKDDTLRLDSVRQVLFQKFNTKEKTLKESIFTADSCEEANQLHAKPDLSWILTSPPAAAGTLTLENQPNCSVSFGSSLSTMSNLCTTPINTGKGEEVFVNGDSPKDRLETERTGETAVAVIASHCVLDPGTTQSSSYESF